MIAEWLMGMAAAGGSALVGAAASDAWHAARTGVHMGGVGDSTT